MPELPEVETVVRTIQHPLRGRTLTDLNVYWERTVEPHVPDELAARVRCDKITEVRRRAKLIVLDLASGGRLTIHLRMTGELLLRRRQTREREPLRDPAYLRAILKLDSGDILEFHDVRKFGRIRLYEPEEWQRLDDTLGVEPLDPNFTLLCFEDMLHSRRRQLKPLLLDQYVIAGLGNIYVDEALYKARVHPLQPSNRVSRPKARALHVAIRETLLGALERRGTTIRNYRTGDGEPGDNQRQLVIYGKKPGTPCPRCGKPLRRMLVAQRGTIFCSNCQRIRR